MFPERYSNWIGILYDLWASRINSILPSPLCILFEAILKLISTVTPGLNNIIPEYLDRFLG